MPLKIKKFYNKFHTRKEHKVWELMAQSRYRFLRDLLGDQKGKVLVIGCGSKDEMSILNEKCDGVGLDLSDTAIKKSKAKYPQFQYIVVDAMDMPFRRGRFDCIVCSEVIEHLPDDNKFLKEAHRILKPAGRLIITTPNWIGFYGLARKLGEALFRKPFTSGDQPIDHWYTYWSLKRKTDKFFNLRKKWGLWFFPPFGKGKYMLPEFIVCPFVKLLDPINVSLRSIFPTLGHCIAFDLERKD